MTTGLENEQKELADFIRAGVPPYGALILTIAAVALFTTGLLANWLPARRAARVDPMCRSAPTDPR